MMIGPYVSTAYTGNELLELGETLNISPKHQKTFEHYYQSIPIIPESSHLFLVLDALGDAIWGRSSFSVIDIESEKQPVSYSVNEFQGKAPDAALIDMKLMEQRYAFENEIMSAVARGQSHKINQLMSSFAEMSFEKRTADPIRNMKNYSIIMNTLLRKAAESGGVHPIYLDNLSSGYAAKIEQVSSISAINALMADMFRSYCRLVRRYSMGDYSPTVQKAIVFIESDLSADLTLSSIAQEQKISSGYLSAVFKRETGRTITEYIRERRIKHAIYLLETTHLQVQTIATHCGIMDVQYFSKIFKRQTGKTPKEYRESVRI
jgi:YesN/AraC family two-component response regulator